MSLTPRECEVAALVARGMSAKGIAGRLGISARTVEEHIQAAASRIPGSGTPRFKLLFFVLTTGKEQPTP